LYRWFVGLSPDDPVWDPTTFTKNRDRLQNGEVFEKFMTRHLNHPQVKPLLSDEHFSVDGTLIEEAVCCLLKRAKQTPLVRVWRTCPAVLSVPDFFIRPTYQRGCIRTV
jgi:transposase